jgi:hypothetical protein
LYQGPSITVPVLHSGSFSVGIGSPSTLEFVDGHSVTTNSQISGGEFLIVAPRIRIVDAGGNLVISDYNSRVKVTIANNPNGGQILPLANTVQIAQGGIVSFPSLRITSIGNGYVLAFTQFSYSALTNELTISNPVIQLLSELFQVVPGIPRKLHVSTAPDRAYSGGQAFNVQPVVQLKDYGDNVVTTDYSSIVTAMMIPSLSADVDIRVQADQLISDHMTNISTTTLSGSYGAGEFIYIDVTFLYEVWFTLSSNNRPYLEMNTLAADGSARRAYLVGNHNRMQTLRFRYVVQPLDSASVLDVTSLYLNGSTVVDGNGNAVSTTLPTKTLADFATVIINTSAPVVTALNSTTPSGDYGAGQVIEFFVTFSMPVTVSGIPWLILNIRRSSSDGIRVNATAYNVSHAGNQTVYLAYAEYDRMHGDSTAVFRYEVLQGDSASALTIFKNIYLNNTSTWIRRTSTIPTTPVNYSLLHWLTSFESSTTIVIDTSAPYLNYTYGVQTTHADGVFFAGEIFYITIQFSVPVSIFGIDISLYMECGNSIIGSAPCPALFNALYGDDKTLEFIFTVPPLINNTRFDIITTGSALQVPNIPYYIRRKSTNPTTDIDANTTKLTVFGHSLINRNKIAIDGFVPVVEEVYMVSLNISSNISANVLYPGDYALFAVKFSTRVLTTCDPVVVVIVGLAREAIYVSGNLTNTLLFKYTVGLGDNADGLSYRFQPNAMCYESGCPKVTTCAMTAYSTLSDYNADLTLPIGSGSRTSGIPIDPNITIFGTPIGRNTTIKRIVCDTPDGSYGAGTIIRFTLTFTDDVIYTSENGIATPMLHLNIGKNAVYSGGSGTPIFSFYYILEPGDATNGLVLSVNASTGNVFSCAKSTGCIIKNRNNQYITQYSPIGITHSSNIVVNTVAPFVEAVFSPTLTSPFLGRYTVGAVIDVVVVFSAPVVIIGVQPRLIMNTSNAFGQQYAYYDADASNSTHLLFQYLVVQGDHTPDLMYLFDKIDLSDGQSIIYRFADLPVTVVNYTLPKLSTLSRTGQIIKIDTLDVPKVLKVYSIGTSNTTYRAGDIFEIFVEFTQYVVCTGAPTLSLNVGDHVGIANFVNPVQAIGNKTGYPTQPQIVLQFNYSVAPTDFSFDLDYIDEFSFSAGLTPQFGGGFIYAASTFPAQIVGLDLPVPGTVGSLAVSSDIYVDGRVTYETGLEILNDAGTYGVGSKIYIRMNFSTEVIVEGRPYILMETGGYSRPAYYVSGNGTAALDFLLEPQPGDFAAKLDYAVDKDLLSTASNSFQMNGKILTKSMNPILPVSVFLNPVGGVLTGTKSEMAAIGAATFLDLTIGIFGPDYQLIFLSDAIYSRATLEVAQTVFVSFSSQFDLVPAQGLPGDAVGWAVAVSGNLVAIGAPNSNISVTTIQTVTTTGLFSPPVAEVNTIQTTIQHQPGKQSFYTTADVGQTVGGYFTMSYGTSGTSRPLPSNMNADMLNVFLSQDFPGLGNVTATRVPYIYCACQGAYNWTITFNDITIGDLHPFSFDGSLLTGTGAAVVGPNIIQSPAKLGGTFSLQANGKQSRQLPVDATPSQLSVALSDLGLSFLDVAITPFDASLARSWIVTFDAYSESYEIPSLTANGTHLTGGNVSVQVLVTREGVHGPSGLAGYFLLTFRENTTVPIQYNASAADMKAALEALPTINYVNVNRSIASDISGYTWTIEFVQVSHNTPRGYVLDAAGNIEPLAPTNHLIGSNTSVKIGAVWGLNNSINFFDAFREGTYGSKAGAVYIFQETVEQYVQVAMIHGNNTDEDDQFGFSVDLQGDLLIVGAVSADQNGVLDKQAIYCSATGGYFTLAFRGWTSDPIAADSTVDELYNAVVATTTGFGRLYNVQNVFIEDWGAGGICDNNTAVITFFSPVDGAPNLFNGTDSGSNLELMTIYDNSLVNIYKNDSLGVVDVLYVQNGTIHVHGTLADPQQVGSAYIFRAVYSCPVNVTICYKKTWVQEAQFFPTFNTNQSTKFGWSVAINHTIAVIGAPGDGSGSVYVYQYSAGSWGFLQRITVAQLEEGDSLGYSIAIFGNTILIGAPFFRGNTGMVVVYKRPASGGVFSEAQSLTPSPVSYPMKQGDLFGISVGVSGDVAIVGAAGRSASTIYTGVNPKTDADIDTGIVYVFTRSAEANDFFFYDVLTPTNVKNFDRFGWSVAIDGDFIVASSMQEYGGPMYASGVIMEVVTSAEYIASNRLGGFFHLEWIYTNQSSGVWRTLRTRAIPYDIVAADLKILLEQDLFTGELIVSRSNMDVYDKGFAWTITFLGQKQPLPPFVGDPSNLNGVNATVTVNLLNPYPPVVRGVSHIFQRPSPTQNFVEQAFLTPMLQEPMDLCGWQVSLNGDRAVVGCPNRDGIVPNTNCGAAMVYSLTLMHVNFVQSGISIPEGEVVTVDVIRTSSSVQNIDVLFYITTIDRNAVQLSQTYLQDLFSLETATIPYPSTVYDVVGVSGKAIARAQYYGSTHNESLWVDGMYDYRGISDYVPLNTPRAYLTTSSTVSQNITTTGDTILELPNEHFIVALNSPGIWPSMLGSLQIQVLIEDNGDGKAAGFGYDKLYEAAPEDGNGFGAAVTINYLMDTMFASTPDGNHVSVNAFGVVTTIEKVGYVLQYKLVNGSWTQVSKFYSPSMCAGCNFGAELKLTQIQNRTESLLVVGEPFANKVHVYYSSKSQFGNSWTFEKTITRTEAYLPEHMFGAQGAIGLYNSMLVVGAAGLEAIFVFYRLYSNSTNSWYWTTGDMLRSSDFDYDIIGGVINVHRQRFGKSVSVSQRSIAVGAPYADYDKLGSDLVEVDWDTEGVDIYGYGRGKVYIFSCVAAVQEVTLQSDVSLSAGTFRLRYTFGGITQTSGDIPYNANNESIAEILNLLYYIDDLRVSVSSVVSSFTGEVTKWKITFVNEFENPPLLEPIWHGYNCSSCTPFSANFSTPDQQVTVASVSLQTNFTEGANFSAYDKASGMRFGWTVALDGNQLLVGAIYSASVTSTSWDFEAGALLGWSPTGTAFNYQPTYGDNSFVRAVYPSPQRQGLLDRGEKSGMIGRYYIGTFEMRPGNSSDWRVPDSTYPQGSYQGDGPTGTLTSDVFLILGSTISFLIGGGCDYYTEYVELIVDGFSVQKQTGDCSERMRRKVFDVSTYLNRAAQIRIVDNSQSMWGHINVDDFQFNWDVSGGRLESTNNRVTPGGKVEAPRSGAVYSFLRHIIGNRDFCFWDTVKCEWTQEIKLTPSDKRSEIMFGSSIVLDDSRGIAVIGAPGAECSGIWREIMSVYPYMNSTDGSNAAGLRFPLDPQLYMATFESVPDFAPEASGANGVWQGRVDYNVLPNIISSMQCGAAYVFIRTPAEVGPLGNVVVAQRWTNTESARFQPSDGFAGDRFASTLSMSNFILAAGATGQDGLVSNGGAVYAYNIGFTSLYFAKVIVFFDSCNFFNDCSWLSCTD